MIEDYEDTDTPWSFFDLSCRSKKIIHAAVPNLSPRYPRPLETVV